MKSGPGSALLSLPKDEPVEACGVLQQPAKNGWWRRRSDAGAAGDAAPLIGRRAFMWTAAVAGVAAVLGEWWGRRQEPVHVAFAPFPVRGAADLPVGSAAGFTVPGTAAPGVVVRLSAATYVAFDRRCPHLGCPVLWSDAQGRFECPCHQASFDARTGAVLAGPPPRGLRPLAIEQRGETVWVTGGWS